MDIIQLLNLVADQHDMIQTIEDPLDQIIADTLVKSDSLEDDELEYVQAAVLPFANVKDPKDEK